MLWFGMCRGTEGDLSYLGGGGGALSTLHTSRLRARAPLEHELREHVMQMSVSMQAGGSSSYEASCDALWPEEADEPQLRLCGGQIWRADPGAAHRLKPAIAGGRRDPPTGRRRMADLVELIDALGQHITDCPPRRRSPLVKGVNSNAIFLFRTLFFRTSSQSHNNTSSLTSRRATPVSCAFAIAGPRLVPAIWLPRELSAYLSKVQAPPALGRLSA